MVSDSELVRRLQEFLRSSDLTTTTTAAVRRQLEADFSVDLSDKKAFIREQVDIFLQNHFEGDKEKAEENADPDGDEEEEDGDEQEEEEENDDEEGASGGKSKGKKSHDRKCSSNEDTKEVKKRGGGFTKLCSLSPQLEKFFGVSELARTEVVKKLWAYIREHDLQEPTNRRKIVCDAKLQEIFKVKVIDMFQMNKALSKHIWPLSSDGASDSKESVEKEKRPRKEKEEVLNRKDKRRKSGNTGFLAPLPLSDALTNFFGTGESTMSRSDVVKRMWDYIKKNELQDPSDKRRIICDEKLKELFKVDSFHGFTVSKLLVPHFVKS